MAVVKGTIGINQTTFNKQTLPAGSTLIPASQITQSSTIQKASDNYRPISYSDEMKEKSESMGAAGAYYRWQDNPDATGSAAWMEKKYKEAGIDLSTKADTGNPVTDFLAEVGKGILEIPISLKRTLAAGTLGAVALTQSSGNKAEIVREGVDKSIRATVSSATDNPGRFTGAVVGGILTTKGVSGTLKAVSKVTPKVTTTKTTTTIPKTTTAKTATAKATTGTVTAKTITVSTGKKTAAIVIQKANTAFGVAKGTGKTKSVVITNNKTGNVIRSTQKKSAVTILDKSPATQGRTLKVKESGVIKTSSTGKTKTQKKTTIKEVKGGVGRVYEKGHRDVKVIDRTWKSSKGRVPTGRRLAKAGKTSKGKTGGVRRVYREGHKDIEVIDETWKSSKGRVPTGRRLSAPGKTSKGKVGGVGRVYKAGHRDVKEINNSKKTVIIRGEVLTTRRLPAPGKTSKGKAGGVGRVYKAGHRDVKVIDRTWKSSKGRVPTGRRLPAPGKTSKGKAGGVGRVYKAGHRNVKEINNSKKTVIIRGEVLTTRRLPAPGKTSKGKAGGVGRVYKAGHRDVKVIDRTWKSTAGRIPKSRRLPAPGDTSRGKKVRRGYRVDPATAGHRSTGRTTTTKTVEITNPTSTTTTTKTVTKSQSVGTSERSNGGNVLLMKEPAKQQRKRTAYVILESTAQKPKQSQKTTTKTVAETKPTTTTTNAQSPAKAGTGTKSKVRGYVTATHKTTRRTTTTKPTVTKTLELYRNRKGTTTTTKPRTTTTTKKDTDSKVGAALAVTLAKPRKTTQKTQPQQKRKVKAVTPKTKRTKKIHRIPDADSYDTKKKKMIITKKPKGYIRTEIRNSLSWISDDTKLMKAKRITK